MDPGRTWRSVHGRCLAKDMVRSAEGSILVDEVEMEEMVNESAHFDSAMVRLTMQWVERTGFEEYHVTQGLLHLMVTTRV